MERLIHVYVSDEEIVATPMHPFYVPKKGWIAAIDLRAGDILVLQSGEYVVIEQIQHEILEEPIKVYNFEVEDFHAYYVGKTAIWVHNECVKAKVKKINPTQLETTYDLPAGTFHREVEPLIISKVKPNYQVGNNPDILMDKLGNIAYQGTNRRGIQDTGLNIIDIFKGLK